MSKDQKEYFEKTFAAFLTWICIGRSIALRRGMSWHDMEDILQDLAIRLWLFLEDGKSVQNPGAFFTTCLINLIADWAKRRRTTCLLVEDIPDPSGMEAQRIEDRMDAETRIRQALEIASPAERSAVSAYLQTGDYELAVLDLLKKEGNSSPTSSEIARRLNTLRSQLTRFRDRVEESLLPDWAA